MLLSDACRSGGGLCQKYASTAAMMTAGKRLAARMVRGHTRLIHTQKIRSLPTMERLSSTGWVISPDRAEAAAVIPP